LNLIWAFKDFPAKLWRVLHLVFPDIRQLTAPFFLHDPDIPLASFNLPELRSLTLSTDKYMAPKELESGFQVFLQLLPTFGKLEILTLYGLKAMKDHKWSSLDKSKPAMTELHLTTTVKQLGLEAVCAKQGVQLKVHEKDERSREEVDAFQSEDGYEMMIKQYLKSTGEWWR
jgi:hypothetical protein